MDLKAHRVFRRVSGHGLARASAQAALLVLTHNLIALHQLRQKAQAALPSGGAHR